MLFLLSLRLCYQTEQCVFSFLTEKRLRTLAKKEADWKRNHMGQLLTSVAEAWIEACDTEHLTPLDNFQKAIRENWIKAGMRWSKEGEYTTQIDKIVKQLCAGLETLAKKRRQVGQDPTVV